MMIAGSMLIQTLLMYSPLFTVWQNAPAPQAVWLSIRTIFINILPIGLTIALIFGVFAALSLIISILGMRSPSIMMFIIMGRALHNFDTMTVLETSGDLCSVSWELRWTEVEIHVKRCPCYALGSTEVYFDDL